MDAGEESIFYYLIFISLNCLRGQLSTIYIGCVLVLIDKTVEKGSIRTEWGCMEMTQVVTIREEEVDCIKVIWRLEDGETV